MFKDKDLGQGNVEGLWRALRMYPRYVFRDGIVGVGGRWVDDLA